MRRIIGAVILVSIALSAGCGSREQQPKEPGAAVEEGSPGAGMKTATPQEDPKESTRRLLYLERALERWVESDIAQEYARRDSMASLIRTYAAENFEAMVADLRTGSPRRRIVMAGTLGFAGTQEAVVPLSEALRDQYYEVVLHALASFYHLAKTRDPNGNKVEIEIDAKPIIAYLSHPRAEVRGNAALALSRVLGPDSSPEFLVPLIAAAEDPDAATRVHAIGAISAMKRSEGLPHLLNGLSDKVQLVRVRAALGLGLLGDKNAVMPLIAVLERDSEELDVRKAAARSLGVIMGQSPTLDAKEWRRRAVEAGLTT
jgi:HEAT repeat protein